LRVLVPTERGGDEDEKKTITDRKFLTGSQWKCRDVAGDFEPQGVTRFGRLKT
jgi:hypothetical protein